MSIRKLLVSVAFFLTISGSVVFGESRVFTDTGGRKIEAEMVSLRGKMVGVRMNGRSFAIPLEKLSNDDRAWVEDWARRNRDYRLNFSERIVDKAGLRETQRKRDDEDRKESWESESKYYELRIGNRSGLDLTGLTIQYQIVVRKTYTQKLTIGGTERKDTARSVTGVKKARMLANTDHLKIALDDVELKTHEWQKRGYVLQRDTETGREYAVYHWDDYSEEERLDGIWVKVYQGDILVGEWKSEGKMVDEVVWEGGDAPEAKSNDPGVSSGDPLKEKKLELSRASDDYAAGIRDGIPAAQIKLLKQRYDQILREYEDLLIGK